MSTTHPTRNDAVTVLSADASGQTRAMRSEVSGLPVDIAPPAASWQVRSFWGGSLVVLAILWIGVCALHYFWLSINTVPPHWDTANHMMSAMRYRAALSDCAAQSLTFRNIKHCVGELVFVDQTVYPPLFPMTSALFSFVAGTSVTAFAMTNVLFIALFMVSMYVIGTALYSRAAGVLAAILMLAYPLVFQTSREFMLEFALLAFTAAAGACLVVSDHFRRTVPTLLFGLTVGLGVLTKFNILMYLVGPVLLVGGQLLIRAYRGDIERRELVRRAMSLSGAAVVSMLVAAVWYWPNRFNFIGALHSVAAVADLGVPILSWKSLSFYANAMIWTQIGPPLCLLLVVSIWRLMTMPARARDFLLVWLVSIYAIGTVVSRKAEHDDIGILIPAALISAIAVVSLRRGRTVATILVGGFIALQLAILTLPEPALGARTGTFGWRGIVTPFPRTEDWKIEAALRSVPASGGRVAVISDHMFINGTVFQFYALQDHLAAAITPCTKLTNDAAGNIDLSGLDFVIAKSDVSWIHPKGDGCFKDADGRQEYVDLLRRLSSSARFALLNPFPLPDGSSLLVFRANRGA